MRKNILYLTRLDPYNLKSWSGLSYFILKALQKNFNVITVGPLSNRLRFFYVFKRFFFSIFGIKFDIDRPIKVAKDFARQIEKKISNKNYEAIVTSEPYLVTFLKTNKPIFIYTDFLFSTLYLNYYSELKVSRETFLHGNYCELISLKRSKNIILTSPYAINHGSKYYKIKKTSFLYLPFGANFNLIPTKKKIIEVVKNKNFKVCNLVSSGVDWNRKGMDKAVELVNKINEKGIKARLYIIGSKNKNNNDDVNKYVTYVKFLDKNNLKDQKLYIKLLRKSHFNILFSKAEAFGLVNIEASAFGLYTITNNTGGISGAIRNHVNGFRFDPQTNCSFIADYIINIFKNKRTYLNKSLSSRNEFDKKFDWRVISKKLKRIIN
jgi:glycosyltransferase involved in cell wall biosynthesis